MDIKFYTRDTVKSQHRATIENTKVLDDNQINAVNIPNGIIHIDRIASKCGVFDKNNQFCIRSARQRYGRTSSIPNAPRKSSDIPFMDQDVIFAGFGLTFHFGHFLIEGMSRIWTTLDKKYDKFKYVFVEKPGVKLPKYVYRFMNMLGIPDENIILVNKTTRFRNIVVPDQSVDIARYSSHKMGRIYNKISSNCLPSTNFININKVYLTRTAMGKRRTFGEEQIQNIFAKNGFTVISPEKLSLDTQIQIIKNASVVAGLAGTALHLAAFMKPGSTLIQIKRNRMIPDNIAVQYLINKIQDVNLVLVDGSIEEKPTSHFTPCPQIVGTTEYIVKFLDDNHFQYDKSDLRPNAQETNAYKSELRKYKIARFYKKATLPILRIISMIGITTKFRRYLLQQMEHVFYKQ